MRGSPATTRTTAEPPSPCATGWRPAGPRPRRVHWDGAVSTRSPRGGTRDRGPRGRGPQAALTRDIPEDPETRARSTARAAPRGPPRLASSRDQAGLVALLHVLSPLERRSRTRTDAIGELSGGEVVDHANRSVVRRFSHPAQEHGFNVGDQAQDPVGRKTWTVVSVDQQDGTIDLKIGAKNDAPSLRDRRIRSPASTPPRRELARSWPNESCTRGRRRSGPRAPQRRSSFATPPAARPGDTPLRRRGEPLDKAAPRIILGLDRSYLAIQGPPGTGKTYLGAMAILAAVRRRRPWVSPRSPTP